MNTVAIALRTAATELTTTSMVLKTMAVKCKIRRIVWSEEEGVSGWGGGKMVFRVYMEGKTERIIVI